MCIRPEPENQMIAIPMSEYKTLLERNERMRTTLRTLKAYVRGCTFGSWRSDVVNIVNAGEPY